MIESESNENFILALSEVTPSSLIIKLMDSASKISLPL